MKNFFAILLIGMNTVLYAQNYKVEGALSNLNTYINGGRANPDMLDKARTTIEEAKDHEKTADYYKMWFVRGQVFQEINNNENLSKLQPNALEEAIKSYDKAIKKDNKGRKVKQSKQYLVQCLGLRYNEGRDLYLNKSYEDAIAIFNKMLPYYTNYGENLAALGVSKEVVHTLLFQSYNLIEKYTEALEQLDLMEKAGRKDTLAPLWKADLYLKLNDTAKAAMVIDKGREMYPKQQDIMQQQLYIYQIMGQEAALVEKLDKAIESDSKNAGFYYMRGLSHDALGNMDKAEADFTKVIELEPESADYNYSLARVYYVKAANINEKMNALSYKEQTKYDAYKKQRDALFKKSLPYFQKAHQINPKDDQTLVALKEVTAKLGDFTKSKEYKLKLEQLQTSN